MSTIARKTLTARLYLCGFPKSGLHWADLWANTLLWQEESQQGNWFGTFDGQAWTAQQGNLTLVEAAFQALRPGCYLKGHMGWSPALAAWLRAQRIGVAFCYRDLRDVLVSQAHHVLSPDDGRLKHPGKALYRALPDFEAVLLACLEGLGPYPGLFERWELYAGWLMEDWTLKLRYEHLDARPYPTARLLVRYLHDLSGLATRPDLDKALAQRMIANGRHTERSVTFRQGGSGGWKQAFTPRVAAAFKARDPGWLRTLGYTRHEDW